MVVAVQLSCSSNVRHVCRAWPTYLPSLETLSSSGRHVPLPGTVRYNPHNPSEDQKFLYEDNLSLYKTMCPSCGISRQKSCHDGPTRELSQTHIYSVSHPQVDRLSAQKETSDQLLVPGPAPPGLALTLAMMNTPLLYCVLVYQYPFNPHPYSNILCTKVKVCGFLQPSPACP